MFSTPRWINTHNMLIVFYLFLIRSSAAQEITKFTDGVSEKEILDSLLNIKKYDKRSRPESLTTIKVNVLLHSLSSPDESSLNYEVEFLLYRTWKDERLKFDDGGRHRYLNGMSHIDDIWLPSTYIVKHGSLKEPLVDMSLRVYGNGTIVHILRRGISINCQGNLKIFPFDNPKCPFAIESVALEEDELQLHWAEEAPLSTASSLQSFNAYLIHSDIGECGEMFTWRGKFSCLHVLLVFTRDKNYYFSSVFVPGIILVTSAFISFWLDKNVVPARVMIGVTTMLSFCTTTNNFRSSLPVVSNLTALNLWDGVCMFFIYSSLLEFVIVNSLYRKHQPESKGTQLQLPCCKCKKGTVFYDKVECKGAKFVETRFAESTVECQNVGPNTDAIELKDNEEAQNDNSKFAWLRSGHSQLSCKELSFKIEGIAKIVFPTLFTIFVLIYFIVFAAILPRNNDNWVIQSSSQYQNFE